MNITAHPLLLDLLAARYALGTLRGGARRRFEAIAREQPAARAVALVWQGRIAGLAELQPAVPPDPAVWGRIRERIVRERAQQPAQRPQPQRERLPAWWRSLGFWRGASLAGAFATVVAVAVGLDLQRQIDMAPATRYVAVLSDERSAAALLVTFDARRGELELQRVGNRPVTADRSWQLWALPPGATPRSLGVLDDGRTLRLPASENDLRAVPALAISLEPRGGVPGDRGPTGPVLFSGPLVEKTL